MTAPDFSTISPASTRTKLEATTAYTDSVASDLTDNVQFRTTAYPDPTQFPADTEGPTAGGSRALYDLDGRLWVLSSTNVALSYSDDGWRTTHRFFNQSDGTFSFVFPIGPLKVLGAFEHDTDSTQDGLYVVEDTTGSGDADRFVRVVEWDSSAPNAAFGPQRVPAHGDPTMLVMPEYGSSGTNRVHFSEDGGETWSHVDVPIDDDGTHGSHIHGAVFDRHADRLWVCQGDGDNQNVWYSDDFRDVSPSWERVWPQFDAPTQFTSVWATPDRVLFGTDGATNGIWSWERDRNDPAGTPEIEPLYVVDPSSDTLYVARSFRQRHDTDVLYMPLPTTTGGDRPTHVLASGDGGETWRSLYTSADGVAINFVCLAGDEVVWREGNEKHRTTIRWGPLARSTPRPVERRDLDLLYAELRKVEATYGWRAGTDPRLVAYDTGRDDTDNLDGAQAEFGPAWEAHHGSWERRFDVLWSRAGVADDRAATIDLGVADVALAADLAYKSAQTDVRTFGLAFRLVDANNWLLANIDFGFDAPHATGGVRLEKVEAGSRSTLGSATIPVGLRTGPARLGVRCVDDRVGVFLNGALILSHTLSSGDQSTFGAATKHGLGVRLATEGMQFAWRNFAVWDALHEEPWA